MIKLLAHRGLWHQKDEQNTVKAFMDAVAFGFGIETDLRDLDGKVVISHDPPISKNKSIITFEEFLAIPNIETVPLALNIKSDGILGMVKDQIAESAVSDYFVFDMTFPQSLQAIKLQLPTFRRVSEFEFPYSDGLTWDGIWLDAFESDWWTLEDLQNLVNSYPRVAIVSGELHGRDKNAIWNKARHAARVNDLYICTDYPFEWDID